MKNDHDIFVMYDESVINYSQFQLNFSLGISYKQFYPVWFHEQGESHHSTLRPITTTARMI